jgi:hypothetical protein
MRQEKFVMKVYDMHGNVIKKGDFVSFVPLKSVIRVTDILEPGVIDDKQPGVITVEMKIPFQFAKGERDIRFGDFIVTRNPAEDEAVGKQIEDILSGKGKNPPLQLRR